MRKLLIIAFLGSTMTIAVAGAVDTSDFDAKTTRDLVNLCSASAGDPHYDAAMGFCFGFIDGALDYHRAVTSGDLLTPIACPAEEATRQEILDAFLAWAKTNPGLLDTESPIQGLMRSASAAWPCN
jgi:hypothetical protein